MQTSKALAESIDRANQAIDSLEASGDFRYDGLTLEQWLEARDNYLGEQVAARFNLPVEWARLHVGDHRCVDGRRYIYSCLVTDPTCHTTAQSYMKRPS